LAIFQIDDHHREKFVRNSSAVLPSVGEIGSDARLVKIGFINNAYYPTQFGGSERSVQLLAESVVRQGHEATVLTISPNEKYEEGQVNGINVTYLPHKNVYGGKNKPKNPLIRIVWHLVDSYNPWTGGDVSRWLRKEKPDLVHTNILGGISVAAWDAVRNYGVPLVHTLREYYLQCRLMSLNRKGAECNGICSFCRICAVPRRARSSVPDAVIGISRHVLDSHLQAGFFAGVPIREVIFNPFLLKQSAGNLKEPTKRLRLGFLGRIESLKGIDFLLKEIQSLPPEAYELYIAGPGETAYTEEFKKRHSDLPIHWLGFMQPEEFFPKIDLLIVPSLWQEPFGRVIVEAYSYGIPVLGSRVGGIPEIIDENVTGFLFDPFTPGSFREKFSGITAERLHAMRKSCIARALEFEPDHIGRQYVEMFSRVYQKHVASD
jgi:glycogen(starch) synthase